MTSDAVAIVGIGCLFPGAASPAELWRNLLEGRDSTSLAGESDLAVDPADVFDPRQGGRDRTYFLRGGYVRDFSLDPRGFAIGPEQVEALDEVARWSLYVAREALRDAAAVDASALARCGVVLGNLNFPTRESQSAYGPLYHRAVEAALNELLLRDDVRLRDAPSAGAAALKAPSPASAIARALGLGGPTLCIDAARASSLYAVKLAADYLAAGKADLMLAGAVSCADPFFLTMGFSIFHAYPEDGGDSRPLDRSSRGLVSGEGAGLFALKRYADALRDGDRIHAVVRGVGLSNDGRGKHLLTPNPKGQVVAFERAYREADVAPSSVPYVECHATGTPLGDPIELESMARFFGADGGRPLVGSVKSNFGHMLTAAGMAGMTKAILAMQHGLIPPTIGVADPVVSPDGTVGGEGVVRAVIDWPAVDGPRRAGVSAFGFGGTNAHLVLEQAGAALGQDATAEPSAGAAPLAIVGMSVHVGAAAGLDELDRIFREGASLLRPPPPKRRKGLLADQSPGALY